MKPLDNEQVKKLLDKFFDGGPTAYEKRAISRESSFDYCFNYFQSFHEQNRLPDLLTPKHVQEACLHLAAYLASWGMYRGKSMLLQRSARQYVLLVETIVKADSRVWALDVDKYTPENFALLTKLERQIHAALQGKSEATSTLTTKVMLGVFGNVPALDTFVCNALRDLQGFNAYGLDDKTLQGIQQFYDNHKAVFDSYTVNTIDFNGQPTPRLYPKAKLVDMALFMHGQALQEKSTTFQKEAAHRESHQQNPDTDAGIPEW